MIANHGRLEKFHHLIEGRNSRLDSIQASILSIKLKYLNDQDGMSKEIIMEGTMAIMNNQIPLMVEKKLMAYLSTSDKSKKSEE